MPRHSHVAATPLPPSFTREVALHSGSIVSVERAHSCGQAGSGAKLSGLSVNPIDAELYATAGDDGTVRLWDSDTRTLVAVADLEAPMRTCAWSSDGFLLAVGFGRDDEGEGGHSEQRSAGGFAVLNSRSLEVLYRGRDSKVSRSLTRH